MADRPRIVLLALDGFPLGAFRPTTTPNLWRIGQEGGYSPDGGRAGLPSTTYPSFATLLTGAGQRATGIRTTSRQPGAVPGWAGEERSLVPTIVHAAGAAGLRAVAVMGDQKLQSVLRLDDIAGSWPPGATVPHGTELDSHGYPTNAAVRPLALEAAADGDLDFLFVHLNEADTIGHDFGPGAPETLACVRAADAIAGELVDALAPDWHRTVIAVTSDHDMTRRLPFPAIDPTASLECAGLIDDWIPDGCAAWLKLTAGVDAHMAISRLASIEGVERWRWREPDVLLLLAAPGRTFAAPWIPLGGIHGSACTDRTLAIVGGGHPAVAEIAASISTHPPRLRDWSPTLAGVLGIDLPDADGTDLLEAVELKSVG